LILFTGILKRYLIKYMHARKIRLAILQSIPRMRGTLNWLLPILPPRVFIRRYISNLITNGRNLNRPLHPQLPTEIKKNSDDILKILI
jgi:hypothetical protein